MMFSLTNFFFPLGLNLTLCFFLPYYFLAVCCCCLFPAPGPISSVWEGRSEGRQGHTPWPFVQGPCCCASRHLPLPCDPFLRRGGLEPWAAVPRLCAVTRLLLAPSFMFPCVQCTVGLRPRDLASHFTA